LWAAASALLLAGCLQVEVTVEMHDKDPGATVRERIRVSRKLQEVCPTKEDLKTLLGHLTEQAARERMKRMGKGISLVSHKREKLPDGSIESRVVYTIPKIGDLRLCNPFVQDHPAARQAAIRVSPQRTRDGKPTTGTLIKVHMVGRKTYSDAMIRRTATPLERQTVRELGPILRDMLSDFQVDLKLTVPTRFEGGHVRNIRTGAKTATLFSLSGRDGDNRGRPLFENEEILLALLQMDFESGRLIQLARTFLHNSTMPVTRRAVHNGAAFSILQTTWQKKAYSRSDLGEAGERE
jgi:hypothetical protein